MFTFNIQMTWVGNLLVWYLHYLKLLENHPLWLFLIIIQCKGQFCSSSFYISGTRAICCVEKYYNGRRLVFWVSVHVFYCKCIVKESSSFGILVAVSFISETTVICGLIVIIYPVWFLLFLWYFGCSVCAISWRV